MLSLFVSDIHIASPEDPKAALFFAFLQRCRELRPDRLFLVGDIFDLWIADRGYFTDRYRSLIEQLILIKESGCSVHYFEGNHDLDLRRFWGERLGFEIHPGPAFFDLDGRRVRVEHGDQMDPEDRGYLFLRWLLRTKVVTALGRHLPNWSVAAIGNRASRASRAYTTTVKHLSDDAVRAKIRAHAEAAHRARPFDLLVSGHVHVMDDIWLVSGGHRFRSVNLGTWLKEPLVLSVGGGADRLMTLDDFLHGK